jgi:MFS family permease
MPLAALGTALIPLALGSGLLPLFITCLLVMVIAMACWRAPLFAWMADLTPSPRRSRANGIMNLMAGLGGVLAFVAGSLLFALYQPLPFWFAALVLLVGCGLILRWVREPGGLVPPVDPTSDRGVLRSAGRWLSALDPAQRRSLFLLTLAVFCYMLGFHPLEAFFSSYGVTVLKLSEANSGLVFSAAYVTFILLAVPAGVLAARIGRKRAVISGLLVFSLTLLTAFFSPVVPVIAMLMGVGGLAWALIDINAFPMFLDIAPAGDRAIGTATGVYFVAATLAAIVGPVLNGWLIDLSGGNYSMIFPIGAAFLALSFIIMLGVKHGEAQERLEEG